MRKHNFNNKSVGVVKEIDSLGRIVIPKELRNLFNLENNVEVVATKQGVLIRNPQYALVRIVGIKKDKT